MITRRCLISGAASATVLGLPGLAVAQQGFPNKQVKIIVPFPPAGPTDLMGRLVADRLKEKWGQPVVAENRPGASGSIGAAAVLQAPADGYTLCLSNNAANGAYELLNPKGAPYVTLRDFAPVALIGFSQLVAVINPKIPANNLKEFIAYVKANPGKVNYASSAIGSSPHLACELLNTTAGISMTHIPFNGAAPALLSVASGDTQIYMGGYSTVQAMVADKSVRMISAFSGQRIAAVPDLMTAKEEGFNGLEWDSWFGVLASSKVPAPILDKINADINEMLGGEEMRKKLEGYGMNRKLSSRGEFETLIKHEYERTGQVIKQANIKVE